MERRNRNILMGLIAVIIVIAVFSSFGLPLFASPTPSISLPTPLPQHTLSVGDEEQSGGVRVEITPATVQSVIAVMDRLGSYHRSVTTILEGSVTTAQTWVDGGWTRSDLIPPAGPAVHTIVGEDRVWRWYEGESQAISWAADDGSADVETQRIPTYEDVLALPTEDITAAGYQEKNGEECVFVEVTVPQLSQRERYWVSADTGLLVAAETETEGVVVWSMFAGAPELPGDYASRFTLPDGTVLHAPA